MNDHMLFKSVEELGGKRGERKGKGRAREWGKIGAKSDLSP